MEVFRVVCTEQVKPQRGGRILGGTFTLGTGVIEIRVPYEL